MTKVSALDQALCGLEHAHHGIEEQERRWRQRVERRLGDGHPSNLAHSAEPNSRLGNPSAGKAKSAPGDPEQ